MKMSRPASAAWYRCQISVFSPSGSALKPSAYNCTTAASSTRSRRYFRSAGAAGAAAGAACVVFSAEGGGAELEQAVINTARAETVDTVATVATVNRRLMGIAYRHRC